jgi:hypothetical protein
MGFFQYRLWKRIEFGKLKEIGCARIRSENHEWTCLVTLIIIEISFSVKLWNGKYSGIRKARVLIRKKTVFW